MSTYLPDYLPRVNHLLAERTLTATYTMQGALSTVVRAWYASPIAGVCVPLGTNNQSAPPLPV